MGNRIIDMTQEPDEKARRYPRIGLPRGIVVAWQAGGARVVSRVGTLGLGGLFIFTKKPAGVGDVLKLVFDVPGGEVRARAVVRSVEANKGMGIEFTSMQPEARARLTQLLRRLRVL
jgi:hypothetical protein